MRLNRRRVLKSAGAIGVVGLAGCSGNGDGDGDGGGDGDGSGDGSTPTTTEGSDGGEAEYTARLATPWSEQHLEYVPANVVGEYSGGKGWKGQIEDETDGRIEVEVFWAGELGTGTEVARSVQQGTAHIGHISLSNLSPYASAVDLVNLPYILGTPTNMMDVERNWLKMHTSDKWAELVDQPVMDNGFVPYYWNQGPRALWTTDNAGAVTEPSQMNGVTHRTPPSDLLNKMWQMVGASPSTIAWGETSQAMEEGVASSMHVGIYSLIFGFQEVIDHITPVNIVSDATAYIISKDWYDDLPTDLQDSIDRAASNAKQEQLTYLPDALQNVREGIMPENEIEFHPLSGDQIQTWADQISYTRSDWDPEKEEFAGSVSAVDDLVSSMEDSDPDYEIPETDFWSS